ncbi:MAG: hypothetical protein GY913_08545 [Proteobacteria bacterium]|nr:hypothetical protein [Pseudomonadota bacterium]MCP4916959.1 hypothetical protein [Pseudomonadota bacterium]
MLALALTTLPDPQLSAVEAELAWIDAVLAAYDGQRAPAPEAFCHRGDWPGGSNRDFLCEDSEAVGSWMISAPHQRGVIRGHLSVRRFETEAAALEAGQRAVARYGAGTVGIHDGAFSWCNAVAAWSGEWVWTLEYGCHVSHHVVWMHTIQDTLMARGEPFHGATAAMGLHSGWSKLYDASGAPVRVPYDERYERQVRVTDVANDDVLWMREGPPARDELEPRVGSLPPDARCVDLVYQGHEGWWKLAIDGEAVWAAARYLKPERPGACPTPAPG